MDLRLLLLLTVPITCVIAFGCDAGLEACSNMFGEEGDEDADERVRLERWWNCVSQVDCDDEFEYDSDRKHTILADIETQLADVQQQTFGGFDAASSLQWTLIAVMASTILHFVLNHP